MYKKVVAGQNALNGLEVTATVERVRVMAVVREDTSGEWYPVWDTCTIVHAEDLEGLVEALVEAQETL